MGLVNLAEKLVHDGEVDARSLQAHESVALSLKNLAQLLVQYIPEGPEAEAIGAEIVSLAQHIHSVIESLREKPPEAPVEAAPVAPPVNPPPEAGAPGADSAT